MKKRRAEKTGIRLWKENDKKFFVGSMDKFVLFLARTLAVGFLALAWWESLLSVFPIELDRKWLYMPLFAFSALCVWFAGIRGKKKIIPGAAGVILISSLIWKNKNLTVAVLDSLANAYLRVHDEGNVPLLLYNVPVTADVWLGVGIAVVTLPLLAVFSFMLSRDKGKAVVLVLLMLPVFLAAVEGAFPSVQACISLFFTAGVYYSISGKHSGRTVWREAVAAGGFLLILSILSWEAAQPIEAKKENKEGRYFQARAFVETRVIQKVEDAVRTGKEKQHDDNQGENASNQEKNEEDNEKYVDSGQVPEDDSLDMGQGAGTSSGGRPAFLTGTENSNLRNIGSFQPGDGEGLWVVSGTLPESTYYLPLEYGKDYADSSWQTVEPDDKVYAEYSQYPENLSRLMELCKKQNIYNVKDAANFIQTEFEENTVYSYSPGTTPGDLDFAEYFLFENKKGFCVHFATTATLMYRMMGFTARYAAGYSIPVSAFEKQEDGSYRAKVTGEMGHAWCETYDNGWVIREHTLPYTGDNPAAAPPASSSNRAQKENWVAAAAVLVLAAFLFWIHASVRRRQKARTAREYADGRGILSLYLMLWDIAEIAGTPRENSLSGSAFEKLKITLPEISGQDWEWIQQAVQQTMFGKQPPSKEIHERLYRLVMEEARIIQGKLTVRKKIRYRYVKCLPLSF